MATKVAPNAIPEAIKVDSTGKVSADQIAKIVGGPHKSIELGDSANNQVLIVAEDQGGEFNERATAIVRDNGGKADDVVNGVAILANAGELA